MLYDNEKDPYQEHNLAGAADFASLQAELESQLKQELKLRNDAFRQGTEYLRSWGYKTDATGTMPYAP